MHYRLPRKNLEYIASRLADFSICKFGFENNKWSVPHLMVLQDGNACPYFVLDDSAYSHDVESLELIIQWAYSLFGKELSQ